MKYFYRLLCFIPCMLVVNIEVGLALLFNVKVVILNKAISIRLKKLGQYGNE